MKVCDIGPTDAKIMLVGEAQGKEEEAKGQPFVGRAGSMLKHMLSHSGIDYNQCRVTNVANERPPGNNFGFFYQDKSRRSPSSRLEEYWRLLREKIERINPNVVIALGAEPLRAITGKRGISEWRGTPLSYKGIKVIPTFHPSYVMRVYGHHPIAEMDLVKALKESKSRDYTIPRVDVVLKPTIQQVVDWLSNPDCNRVSFDIETIGKHIRCISLARRAERCIQSICIPFFVFPSSALTTISPDKKLITFDGESDKMGSYWNKEDEVIVLDLLAELFANKDIQKVGQNSISFDAPLLEDEFGLHITNHYFDTMHAWHVLYPELPKSLDMLCSLLTNYPNYWTEKDTENDMSEWHYGAMDSVVALDVSYTIENELKDANLLDFYLTHVHPLSFALSDASRTGVLIDKKIGKEIAERTKINIDAVQVEINELAGEELNPNSHKQVSELLYEKLKFPAVYKKKKSTVDEEALRKLERRYPDEKILAKIIEFRKGHKLISTFLEPKVDEDGRMRTSYNASGTKGARISSSQNLWGGGMNLQNVPVGKSRGVENIRHMFVAGDGNVLVKGDLSQAETRVTSEILYRIGDPTLHDLYKDPEFDIHRWGGTFIFGKLENDITKHEREITKIRNHSGNYCAGPRVLMKVALKNGIDDIDYEFSKRMIAAGHKAIPGLRKWWSDVEMQLRRTRTITTCLGRRRIFFGRLDDNATIRDAVACEPQSTVGDVLNIIFRRLHKSLDADCKLILQVHDELVVECPEDRADYVVKEMQKASIVPLFINEEPLIIPLDISVGKNWRDCYDFHNPLTQTS